MDVLAVKFYLFILATMTAVSAFSDTITLSWDSNPSDELVWGYAVYERIGEQLVSYGYVRTNRAVLLNATVGHHCYRVTAVNPFGESPFSKEACADILTAPAAGSETRLENPLNPGPPPPPQPTPSPAPVVGTAPPSGDYEVDFGTPATLWDISGAYQQTLLDDGTNKLGVDYTITVSARGRITGSGTYHFESNKGGRNIVSNGKVSVYGRLIGRRGSVRAIYSFRLAGEGTADTTAIRLSARILARTALNAPQPSLNGTIRGLVRVTIPGQRRMLVRLRRLPYDIDIPPGMDGQWSLYLEELTPGGLRNNRLNGTALIRLSNGTTFSFDRVRGRFNQRRASTILSVTSTRDIPASRGISVRLWAEDGELLNVTRVVIRCLGQTIRVL